MTTVRRTSTTLADGRELIYFDELPAASGAGAGSRDPVPVDRRDLPPRAGGSQLRYDPILDEWVAIASHRQSRTFLPPTDQCPLCPSTADRLTEIPAEAYDVVVFENRFPSLEFQAGEPPASENPELWPRRAGIGRCEVVCFTSNHDSAFAELTPERVATVMTAWVDRTTALGELAGVEEVFVFENRGEEIGVTLHHPHGQIYAYPFVTPRTRTMLAASRAYASRTGRNVFDDVVAGELAAGVRVVRESEHWVAFVPEAARFPVEVHLYPRRRVPDLVALTPAERDDFGPVYLAVLRALDANFDVRVPYIAAWHQAPIRSGRTGIDALAAHLEVTSTRRAPGKLKYVAGSESAKGVWINDVLPEQTAERLRGLISAAESSSDGATS